MAKTKNTRKGSKKQTNSQLAIAPGMRAFDPGAIKVYVPSLALRKVVETELTVAGAGSFTTLNAGFLFDNVEAKSNQRWMAVRIHSIAVWSDLAQLPQPGVPTSFPYIRLTAVFPRALQQRNYSLSISRDKVPTLVDEGWTSTSSNSAYGEASDVNKRASAGLTLPPAWEYCREDAIAKIENREKRILARVDCTFF